MLGNLHRQHRFAVFADLGAFGDEAQAIEVHVGAAGHGHQGLPLELPASDVRFHARHRESASRLKDGAGVFKDILDGGADGVVVDGDHRVNDLAGQRKGLHTDFAHRDTVGKEPHLLELHPFPQGERAGHGIRIDRFNTDHFDVGPEALDVGAHAGDQAAATHGDVDRVRGFRALPEDLEADGPLAGDHLRVIEGVDKGQTAFIGQSIGLSTGGVVGVAFQHHFRPAGRHGPDFHLRRGHRHHDHRPATESLSPEGHPLGVVAGAGGDDAPFQLRRAEAHHLVVSAPQLEAEDRLQVLALQEHVVLEPPREVRCGIERRFNGHVVDPGPQDSLQHLHAGARVQGRAGGCHRDWKITPVSQAPDIGPGGYRIRPR